MGTGVHPQLVRAGRCEFLQSPSKSFQRLEITNGQYLAELYAANRRLSDRSIYRGIEGTHSCVFGRETASP